MLVEFAALDRFHRAIMFPFIKGYAESSGITTRWLRFAIPASSAFLQKTAGVALSASDRQKLSFVVRDFRPDAVFLSQTPSEEIHESLKAAEPSIRILNLGKGTDTEWMEELGRNDPSLRESQLMETIIPNYGFEPANEKARDLRPLPFVFIGEECSYSRTFASNPFFERLSLSGCIRKGGCAFCTRPEHRGPWKTDPMVLLRRQIEAIARTLPVTSRGLEIRLVGESVIANIEAVASEASRCPVRPLKLLIDCRTDRFLKSSGPIRRALDSLGSSGCRIEICLMGVENFCSRELIRLNKGLTPETNIRAIRQLFELEQAFPSSFGFRTHGGISMITLTPWTTPTELVLNLMVVRLLGLEHATGKFLTGRLRLHPGLPLTEAASRDGLLIDRYQDPLLDTARLNMYELEIPWKFAQPEMEELNRVFIRLGTEVPLPKDPVMQALDNLGVKDQGVTSETTDAAIKLVDWAMQASWSGSYPSAEKLIEKALVSSPANQCLPVTFEQWTRYKDVRRENIEALLALKPVIKLEPVTGDDRKHFEGDPVFPNVQCRKRGFGDQKEVFEVFFGRRKQDVEEAIHLAAQLEILGGQTLTRALTCMRMGLLLGYPSCCVTTFADAKPWFQDNFFWLHVMSRIENPREVPCELNPAGTLLDYVPCSTGCPKSLKMVDRILAGLEGNTEDERQAWLDRQRNPALIFWAVQGDSVELVPENEPSEKFRYRAGRIKGSNPLLEWVGRGDELVLEEECTTVLKQGRPLLSLSGRAFLWWHKRSFQTDFWRSLTEALDVHDPREAQRPQATDSPPSIRPTNFTRSLFGLLDRLRKTGAGFAGFVLSKSEITREDRVRAALVAGNDRVVLDIGPNHPGGPCYLEAGPFLLTYPLDFPIVTERQRKAACEFAAALAHLSRTSAGPS